MSDAVFDYDSIPILDRIRLVEDIWDSIAASTEQVPVTDAQREELDRRRQAHETEPLPPVSWTDARARIVEQLRTCR
jgi:putative addiction module component (TIGR02574 family)